MANYRLNSLDENVRHTENFPREGQVTEVCRGWLVHEDQALAYRLQNEEFSHHFGNNREKNAILRQDTPRAREEQLIADEEAARAQNDFEMELVRQEARDAAVANQLARQLDLKEEEEKANQEKKDLDLAKTLAGQEKIRIRHAKELRQVEREAAYLGINDGLDNVAILSRNEKSAAPKPRRGRLNENRRVDLTDLSDFCLKPSPSMDEDEMRKLQEGQDEELARLLQEQDLKRRGDILQKDQLVAIEVQDRELAKIVQEQEKARAKKSKEKARQKAIIKQQDQTERFSPTNSHDISFSSINSSSNIYETPALEDLDRPHSPQYASPDSVRQARMSPASPQINIEAHTPARNLSRQSAYRLDSSTDVFENSDNIPTYTNIACAIDPTYQRRIRTGELPPPTTSPTKQLNTSTNSSRSSTCSNHVQPAREPSTSPQPVFEDDEDYLPPPYMPIQGQRRVTSLEKPAKKPEAKKKSKTSGCNQQ